MGLSRRAERLRDTAPFDSLEDEALDRAAELADEVCLPAGFLVVDEDDAHDLLLVIAAGTATAFSPDGEVRTLGPGAAIGELSPAGWDRRHGRVVASTPMRLFMFDTDDFTEFLTDHPGLVPPSGGHRAGTRRPASRRSTAG
jgi:CRP-like cAMP-binding protein